MTFEAAVVAGLAVAALVVAGAVVATGDGELAAGVSEAKETESPLAWQVAMAPVE